MEEQSIMTQRDWATIRKAFGASDRSVVKTYGTRGSVNLSDVFTKIIQDAGRFAESYASDALYQIGDVERLANGDYDLGPDEVLDKIVALGIRRHGVDHASFLMHRLKDTHRKSLLGTYVFPERVYRRILAVQVTARRESYGAVTVECEMRDIMDRITDIDPGDLRPDGKLKSEYGPDPSERPAVDACCASGRDPVGGHCPQDEIDP